MKNFVVLSTSVKQASSSRRYVPVVESTLSMLGHRPITHDVRNLPPFWMGPGGISQVGDHYLRIAHDISQALGVVLIVPVYCYTASSVAKCMTEIFNDFLEYKPIVFIVSAGTDKSYLAIRDLMSSATFEQSSICYPKILFDSSDTDTELPEQSRQRCIEIITSFSEFCLALNPFVEKQKQPISCISTNHTT